MRFRRPARADAPPPMLMEFRPADWPVGALSDRLRDWKVARSEWKAEHGWPGDDIDFTTEQFRARRAAHKLPVNPQDATSDQQVRWA